MTATRLDIISDVSLLQARVTVAEVKDIKVANAVLDKVKRYSEIGLHYRQFETENLRLVCVHDASSASKGRHYAQEGVLILLADDKWTGHTIDLEEEFDSQSVKAHGGVMHVLHSHGAKAKRVSYSTSHAETLSMVNALESSTLITTRLTELAHHLVSPTIAQLTELQEHGNPSIPSDFYTDCQDLWELVTGMLTLPQDKSQRLYVLGIREARLCDRIRRFTLVPTQSMLADGLTKPMEGPALLLLLSAGKVEMFGVDGHPVKSRVLPSLRDMEENDLLMSDEEVMKVVKTDNNRLAATHATVMAGMMAVSSMKGFGSALTAAMMVDGTKAQKDGVTDGDDSSGYAGVYMAMFLTVILATFAEKFITKMMAYVPQYDRYGRLQNDAVIPGIYAQQALRPEEPSESGRKRKGPGEENDDQGGSMTEDMEIDEIYGMDENQLRRQLVRLQVDLEREQYLNKKILEQHKEEKDELMDKIHTLRNKTGENADYTNILAKHKQEFKEKYEQAEKNYREAQDRYREYYDKYGQAMHQVAETVDNTRALEAKIKKMQAELANVKNDNVDLYHNYERVKKELKDALDSRRSVSRTTSRTPAARTPDSRDEERSELHEAQRGDDDGDDMDIDELREKFDDMKDDLEQKSCEVKDLEKQLEDQKKDFQEKEVRYTVMMNDFGNIIQQKDEKINGMTQEADGLKQRCQNYDTRNRELQADLNVARAPERICFCRHGDCYHKDGCNHIAGRQVNVLRKCKDCLP